MIKQRKITSIFLKNRLFKRGKSFEHSEHMFTSVSQLLQEIRDNFLKLIEILNEAQETFRVTKDVDIVLQFWKFKTIFAELKKN